MIEPTIAAAGPSLNAADPENLSAWELGGRQADSSPATTALQVSAERGPQRSDDPLLALEAEWRRIDQQRNRLVAAGDGPAAERCTEAQVKIEDQIAAALPVAASGAAAQLRHLQRYLNFAGIGDHADRLVGNLLSWLDRQAAGEEPAARAAPAAGGDAALVALFHDWQAVTRAFGQTEDEVASDQFYRRSLEIEREIYETPAAGATGLAIKSYMVARIDFAAADADQDFALCAPETFRDYAPEGHLHLDVHCIRGLIASAVQFLPEIAPFAEPLLSAPVRIERGSEPGSEAEADELASSSSEKSSDPEVECLVAAARATAAANTPAGADPIVALIAECERLLAIGAGYRRQAEGLYFALPKKQRKVDDEEIDRPAPMGPLYAKAVLYETASSEIYDQLQGMKPATLAGALAMLEWMDTLPTEALKNLIEGLRDIAAREPDTRRSASNG